MRQEGQTTPLYQYSQLTAERQNAIVGNGILSGEIATFDGKLLPEFERRVADLTGRAQALAVDSGSSALRLAMRGLGIGHGHEVIIPEVGWVSIGAAADMLGATVRVAPVTDTLTPTWDQIEPLITPATRAVVIAHLRGRPALGTAEIARRLREWRIALVEDCAQAWGVDVEGRPAGGWGTLATFSTHTYKLVASGEGGVIVGDEADTVALLRAIGGDTRQPTPRAVWRSKARMTELAAGLALPQLDYLSTLVTELRTLQQKVLEALADRPDLTLVPEGTTAVGNGTIVGLRLPSAAAAEQLASALFRTGYRSWWPGPGDLHTAAAWPVQAEHPLIDPRRYLDVQIPWLPVSEQHNWAAELAAHIGRSLMDAR
ncbi:aminotransferase class I/II-fold pyridoxal phosphate-dependent enzyme [Streptomyces sp. NPDC046862]|uniref:DegT/DnrJ/EryC1/StrS family aminotransferase n=1 Tax=Streptomyces sp. NPDC046862 TaxID=3154603 RepID=UPI0034546772